MFLAMYRTVAIFCLAFLSIIPAFAQTNGVTATPLRPTSGAVQIPPAPAAKPGLAWDSDSKTYASKFGEASAPFVFTFTNVSAGEIVISNAQTSCGCTVAQLPMQPWPIAPGATGEIKVAMNLAGKMGHVTKFITVNSSEGSKTLSVNVDVAPAPAPSTENLRGDRNANMELAKANRQAIFGGDCRSCHVDKGIGKLGQELFVADCAICHDTPQRAAMVPDLRAPKAPRDQTYWQSWIAHGRIGSMMPAFASSEGGPLSPEQIDSLVTYLLKNFPQGAVGVPTPPVIPAPPAKTGAGQ